MIEPLIGFRSGRPDGNSPAGVKKVGGETCSGRVFIIQRTAERHDIAVRQHRRVHLDAGLRHRRSIFPLR